MLILNYLYSKLIKGSAALPFLVLWLVGKAIELSSIPWRQRFAVDNFRTQVWKDFLEKKLGGSTSKVAFDGKIITFANRGSQDFWRFQTLERKELDTVWWLKHCAANHYRATLVDVGANVGIYSLAWLSISQGRASCFEPLPSNVNSLLRNLALNEMEQRVQVFQLALSSREGISELQAPSLFSGEGFARISNDTRKRPEAIFSWKVPSYRLDSIEIPGDDLIVKIDVEGHELDVIEGMTGLLDSGRVIEVLIEKNPRQDEVIAMLASYGFSKIQHAPHGGNIILGRRECVSEINLAHGRNL